MTCEVHGNAIVCRPRVVAERRLVRNCPTCKARRRMYGALQWWYGWAITCCTCGETWQDGEMCPRPFMRGWRKESSAKARKRYAAVRMTPRQANAAIRAECEREAASC